MLPSLSIKSRKGAGLPALPELRALTETQTHPSGREESPGSLFFGWPSFAKPFQTQITVSGHQRYQKVDKIWKSEKPVAVNVAIGVGVKAIQPSVLLPKPRIRTLHSPMPRAKSGMLGNTSGHLLKSRKARPDCSDPGVLNQPTTRAPAQTQGSRCSSSFHFLSELLSNICVSF